LHPELVFTKTYNIIAIMDKRIASIVITLIFSTMMFAQQANESSFGDVEAAPVEQQQQQQDLEGIHPWAEVSSPVSPELSYWSLYIDAGFNVFDGDFNSEKKHGVGFPTAGLGVIYNFNNTWSIGGEYLYRKYQVLGKDNQSTAATLLRGQTHQIDAYITFDIFNAWRPQNRYKLFALNLLLGGGLGWYKNDVFYPNVVHYDNHGVYTPDRPFAYQTKQQEQGKDSKFTPRAVFLGGATFEFNLNRSIALGVRAVYNYFVKDDIDGRPRGNNNDGIFDVTAMLRWKIDAMKRSHVVNFNSNAVLARVVDATSEAALDDQTRRRGNGQQNKQQASQINNYYYMNGSGNGEKDTLVIHHRDTIVAIPEIQNSNMVYTNNMTYEDRFFYAYFDPSEYVLYDQSLMTIQQVADRLKRDPELCVVITGYCDNTGTNEFNNTLGRRRALVVADELQQEHGIKEYRIKCFGKGIIRGLRSTAAYAPNRRAELQLMSREEFDNFSEEMIPENQTIPTNKTIVVKAGDSLSKLARKYYGNSNCWVFIYEANKSTIGAPTSLREGIELDLPDLSAKQRMISHDEAAARAEKFPTR